MFLQLATSAARVSAADEATPELLSEIVAGTVRRLSAPGEAALLHQLIESRRLDRSSVRSNQPGAAALANTSHHLR